jgi:hypothetical protein
MLVVNGEAQSKPTLLVDTHVHLHDCFDPDALLEHAHRNFEAAGRQLGWDLAIGALMLTESAGVDWFGRLGDPGARPPPGNWRIEPTPEPASLLARSGARRLLLVAGRQVVCRERLEVLLLGTRVRVADGAPIREVLAAGSRNGALCVIPWGAGKWLFGRGRLVSELIAISASRDGFFLGDTSGRPFFWARPRHFVEAERRGVRVLPGTDPLPFPSQVSRAGGYGLRLEGAIDLTRPAEWIKAALRDPAFSVTPYGRLERLAPFLHHQVAMQRLKRRRATG